MLKHVGHHRSTSSMSRTSCGSLKVRGGEQTPPKIIRTQDDSALLYETTMASEVLFSSPELLRKNLSSPESCTSDLGSPEIIKRCTKSGRSQSLQSSPVVRKKLLDVPEDFESVSFNKDFLDVPTTFRNLVGGGHDSDEDPHSSPEITKKDLSTGRASTLPRRGANRTSSDVLTMQGICSEGSPRPGDNCSLISTGSFSSFIAGKLGSRASSTSSLSDQTVIPVKVYLRFMKPDIEYKTMRLSTATTCRQLITLLLAKFRLRHRDPNLFFVRMEITVRSPGVGAPTRRILALDDQARPAELQQCRPRGDARFSVGVRRGGLLRIYDSILMPGSQYKSLLVSYRTTAEELVQLLLNCYNSSESPRHYAVHEVNKCPYSDRQLRPDEYPLLIQSEWPRPSRLNYSFVLRRNANYALRLKSRQISWRRSLDQSSTDTESEHEDHLAPSRKARAPSLPVTHISTFKTCSNGSLLNDPFMNCIQSRSLNVSLLSASAALSPSISRVSCDSGFSSPSSSSRSSTASAGSPSPPGSPSFSNKYRTESRLSKSSSSASTSSKTGSVVSVLSNPSKSAHQPVTVTVNQVTVSPQKASQSASITTSDLPTPVHVSVVPTQGPDGDEDTTASCILTIPLSPIPVPLSPPPLSLLSSSAVVTAFSPASSSPVVSTSPCSKVEQRSPCPKPFVRTNPLYSFFTKSEEPSSTSSSVGATIIPPSSAPPSPSSPRPTRRGAIPLSPSAPTSPCKEAPPPLQKTVITIPSSGPSVVTSNSLSSASAGMRELTAALESLRTLTIRCPNYDSCFYI